MFSRSCISSITKGFCITFRMVFGEFYDTNGTIEKLGWDSLKQFTVGMITRKRRAYQDANNKKLF